MHGRTDRPSIRTVVDEGGDGKTRQVLGHLFLQSSPFSIVIPSSGFILRRLESDGMPFVSPGPFFSFFCDFSATGHCKKGGQMEMGSGGGLKWRQAGL